MGGGWFGYLGYQLAPLVEPVPPSPPRPVPIPAFSLAFYDHVLRFDPAGQWWFEALWSPAAEDRLGARLELMRARLAAPAPEPHPHRCGEFAVRPTRAGHIAAVRACRESIRTGELYQANLTLRLEAELDGDAIDLFATCAARLRPRYAAFVGDRDHQVACLSPELFLARRGREVRTAPIKGTAPRVGEERAGAGGLLASEKDRAENVMIVDLMRNDLGRVCEYGSVTVAELAGPEAHPGVWHLVSDVRGRLTPGASNRDLLRATFPPGSVTGAPKVKAMEVIARLESTAREAYTGAIGYASPTAGLELNVAIRTFEIAGRTIWLGAGGGIVADSDPDAEYRECLDKARPLLAAAGGRLREAGGAPVGGEAPVSRHPRPDPALGLLETLALVAGRPIELEGHLERLRTSAREVYGGAVDGAIGELERSVRELPLAHAAGVHRVRLVLRPPRDSAEVEVEVVPVDLRDVAPGWAVELLPVTVPGGLGPHKWVDRRLVSDAVRGRDGSEALIVDLDGTILETGSGNVFVVENGSVSTPPADGRILPGITRAIVRDQLGAREEPISLGRLRAADELFVTSSVRGVQGARLATAVTPGRGPLATAAAHALARRWGLSLPLP